MIRAGLPVPALHRFAFGLQATAHRWARDLERARHRIHDWLSSNMLVQLQVADRHSTDADIRRSALLLADFEEQFEELVDLLCWSAKDGNHTGRDERYARVRSWFLVRYDIFRPGLRHFLPTPGSQGLQALSDSPAGRDVFESLFLPTDVAESIHSASVIDRISSARAALEAYRAHVGYTKQ